MQVAKGFFESREYWIKRLLDHGEIAHVQFTSPGGWERYAVFRHDRTYSMMPVGGWEGGAQPGTLAINWDVVRSGTGFEVYSIAGRCIEGCKEQSPKAYLTELRSFRQRVQALHRNWGFAVYKDSAGVQWYISSDSFEIPYLVRLHRDNNHGEDGFGAATLYDAVAYIQQGTWDLQPLVDNKPVNYMALRVAESTPEEEQAPPDLRKLDTWLRVEPDPNGCMQVLHPVESPTGLFATQQMERYQVTLDFTRFDRTGNVLDITQLLVQAKYFVEAKFKSVYKWKLNADAVTFHYLDFQGEVAKSTLSMISIHDILNNRIWCSPHQNINCVAVRNTPWK